ncbi:LysR family transcriptional regulator [Motiliproteus sp. MSK22-1]|uniref:LysR family transcriptional regulator n=1 Tax=Motiliproteus sp. MSK22-1 TaxID=1897630 RepID=UPI0009757FEA|nr:LysR family transcriptional regulator [Motiliproteus sp. MSK22-1]OMH31738.1 hypothetical protein BGP75_16580 [Motiliproteus sp. MSK22-1]
MDIFKAMTTFVRVVEDGTFSAAADRLQTPVSSVSRQVRALEEHLGTELMLRSTRSLQLTEIGKLYLNETRQILEGLSLAEDLVANYHQVPKGVLRISAMPSYGEQAVVPLLAEFEQLYPEIVIDLELTDQLADFNQSNIELAFRGGTLPDERLVAQQLDDNRFYLCASPSYLEYNGIPRQVSDLQYHKALLYRAPHQVMRWLAIDNNNFQTVSIEEVLITNSASLLMQSVLAGKGLAMLPLWGIRESLRQGDIQLVELEQSITASQIGTAGIYMLYQRLRYEVPKIRAAVDFFKKRLTASCD